MIKVFNGVENFKPAYVSEKSPVVYFEYHMLIRSANNKPLFALTELLGLKVTSYRVDVIFNRGVKQLRLRANLCGRKDAVMTTVNYDERFMSTIGKRIASRCTNPVFIPLLQSVQVEHATVETLVEQLCKLHAA